MSNVVSQAGRLSAAKGVKKSNLKIKNSSSKNIGDKFLKKLWCCVGGSITR